MKKHLFLLAQNAPAPGVKEDVFTIVASIFTLAPVMIFSVHHERGFGLPN